MKEQADSLFMQALEYAKQIGERAAESIHRPCRDHVELFRVHRLHHGVKRRRLIPALGAADPGILVDFYADERTSAAGQTEKNSV